MQDFIRFVLGFAFFGGILVAAGYFGRRAWQEHEAAKLLLEYWDKLSRNGQLRWENIPTFPPSAENIAAFQQWEDEVLGGGKDYPSPRDWYKRFQPAAHRILRKRSSLRHMYLTFEDLGGRRDPESYVPPDQREFRYELVVTAAADSQKEAYRLIQEVVSGHVIDPKIVQDCGPAITRQNNHRL